MNGNERRLRSMRYQKMNHSLLSASPALGYFKQPSQAYHHGLVPHFVFTQTSPSIMSEIIVDDTDPGIQYSNSGWFEDYGSQDADGNWGPTYNKSLHGTKTNGNFSFSFQGESFKFACFYRKIDICFSGNSVAVYGTNARINTTMGLDPSWECFVNNVNIGASSNVLSPAENNFLLCSQVIMDDGIHQLTVQATSNTGQPFWFDFIRYRPSSTVSEPIASILIQRWDQAINYGAGWSAYGTIANYTSNQGAEFWYNFTGI